MGTIKGCSNELCEAYEKITYKNSESYCSKCGSSLVFICKDCYTILPDDTDKYCTRCRAKHEDRKNNMKKILANVGGGIIFVVGVALKSGKKNT